MRTHSSVFAWLRLRTGTLFVVAAVAVSVGVFAAAGTGCTVLATTDNGDIDSGSSPLNETDADTSNTDATTTSAIDGGVRAAFTGSPLCHASASVCYPDTPIASTVDGGDAAASVPIGASCSSTADGGTDNMDDAGYASDGANSSTLACRVRSSTDDKAAGLSADGAPACAASGAGGDGVACKTGAECAAGYDCVGSGVCRKYCCAGECSGKMNDANNFFCDIVSLTEENTLVPACVPVAACTLLNSKGCSAKETCAIVKEDGTTSCLPVGAAAQGESCDEVHCGAGLTCLGQPGARQCFQLCELQDTTCPTGLTCKANALSHDPAVGICQ